ncbi:MAG: DUF1638 domain-containing protein [Rhizobiales bacterium]|nr:DUF1638 domain-containing protein [Hyphomicrobiales bacterium]
MNEKSSNLTGAEPSVLVIACGALANEIIALKEINGLAHMSITCLPANYHNTPMKIPDALRAKIHEAKPDYDQIFIAYGDCGTGGALDRVIEEEGVERIGGAHCYAFFAGLEEFDEMHMEHPGTFYLTDFLVRHFDNLVFKGLGLDRFPELMDTYFGNYERLMYLAQTEDEDLTKQAEAAAQRLNLDFARRFTGYGELGAVMAKLTPPVPASI